MIRARYAQEQGRSRRASDEAGQLMDTLGIPHATSPAGEFCILDVDLLELRLEGEAHGIIFDVLW